MREIKECAECMNITWSVLKKKRDISLNGFERMLRTDMQTHNLAKLILLGRSHPHYPLLASYGLDVCDPVYSSVAHAPK